MTNSISLMSFLVRLGRCRVATSSGLLDADRLRKIHDLDFGIAAEPKSRNIAAAGIIASAFGSLWFTPGAFFDYRVI
jgi:hypothetical protein